MSTSPSTTGPPEHVRRRLPMWVTLAIAVSFVGPTLAMEANGPAVVAISGKSVPLVFVIGLLGVGLVGYGFIRLTRRFNHAGSVYALVGITVGPRAGYFAGWAMLGAYVMLTNCLFALFADFVNAFLIAVHGSSEGAPQVSWMLVTVVSVAVCGAVAVVDTRKIGLGLIAVEALGIVGMIVVSVVIIAKGGAPSTGIDLSTFGVSEGVGTSGVISGVVIAFLSWAGFESAAALGEETDNPRRNIPAALFGTLAITGVLFIFVMFAQTIGFGTDEAGLGTFATSGNSMGDLGTTYVNRPFGIFLILAGVVSVFASSIACVASAGRLTFAFARDGLLPRRLAEVVGPRQVPRNAMWLVLALTFVSMTVNWATGWPDLGTGIPSLDAFIYWATAGAVALMVAYLMAEVAAIAFATLPRFAQLRADTGNRLLGVALPAVGLIIIVVVLWYNVKDVDNPLQSPAYLGIAWALLGLLLTFLLPGVTAKMRSSLTRELGIDRTEPDRENPATADSAASPMMLAVTDGE